MAKFKVGDKVRLVEDVKAGTAGAWTLTRGSTGVVDEVQSVRGKEYLVEFPEGSFYVGADKVAANSAPRSTNTVVQNALKAKACNGINDWWGFRKGDKVRAKYWKNPNAVGIVTGLASMGGASDGSDTFLFVDFPTEKNVSCSIKELVRNSAVAANAVDPLNALSSAETFMRQAIGELGKVNDSDLRPLASKIAVKLKAVQGELRRELEA